LDADVSECVRVGRVSGKSRRAEKKTRGQRIWMREQANCMRRGAEIVRVAVVMLINVCARSMSDEEEKRRREGGSGGEMMYLSSPLPGQCTTAITCARLRGPISQACIGQARTV
jgi:hypothetical protein